MNLPDHVSGVLHPGLIKSKAPDLRIQCMEHAVVDNIHQDFPGIRRTRLRLLRKRCDDVV